jgi:hypothetical protein
VPITMTSSLPLPVRFAGGYAYSDRLDGVLAGVALPMEVRTCEGPWDGNDDALAALAAAPVGAIYEVARECRPEEGSATGLDEWAYRKVGAAEWAPAEVGSHSARVEARARIAAGEDADLLVHAIDGDFRRGLSSGMTRQQWEQGGYTSQYYRLGDLAV